MRKQRKHYTAEEKVAIVSGIWSTTNRSRSSATSLPFQPAVFCRWQKEFFENGAAAFQTNNPLGLVLIIVA